MVEEELLGQARGYFCRGQVQVPREFQLAPSLAMVQCPPGYRSLQPQDLAAGKDVLYISRNLDTSHIIYLPRF